ncbi:hypothetical protein C5167_042996 [Papaver somniferum]|uniref:Uncharacterized protein n=1 Tax=Papaver somniferum TaxID=3469 RepID=A0A4Y7L899_PAPSO|nr:hypothetical protein C5167_042996 [Papaver somniferum]
MFALQMELEYLVSHPVVMNTRIELRKQIPARTFNLQATMDRVISLLGFVITPHHGGEELMSFMAKKEKQKLFVV